MYVYMSKDIEENERLFWSNEDGWVDLDTATEFSRDEILKFNVPMNPPYNTTVVEKRYAQMLMNKETFVTEEITSVYNLDEKYTRVYPVMLCYKEHPFETINMYGLEYYLFEEWQYRQLTFLGDL